MRNVISSIIFCLLTVFIIIELGDIALPKDRNTIVYEELNKKDEQYDVLVFGSCHAYTSFNPLQLWREEGITSYNVARPSENMASEYLNIYETLKTQNPKVILVETWGLQAHNTYIDKEQIFNYYFTSSLDILPFSIEKIDMINEFSTLDQVYNNLKLARYKDRFVEGDLHKIDFDYSGIKETSVYDLEMESRMQNKGFKSAMNVGIDRATFDAQTTYVDENQVMPVEADMLQYIDRIVNLCKEKNVKPIFYRAPYTMNEEEAKKTNFMYHYFKERGLAYYNLEKEIDFDYDSELFDYAHLNTQGSVKSTAFLTQKILETYTFENHKNEPAYQTWNEIEQMDYIRPEK